MRGLAAALLLLLPLGARAESLIVSLSTEAVSVSSTFLGETIAVFGVIEREDGLLARAADYDIAVVLRGPPEAAVVRRKEPLLGLWINRRSEEVGAPGFYAVHSSRPLLEIATPETLRAIRLGAENLDLGDDPELIPGETPPGEPFRQAYVRLKTEQGLYVAAPGTIAYPGANLFATSMALPATVPVGTYTAEIYLLQGGVLLAEAHREVVVSKAGLERLLYDASRELSLVYALAILCVAGLVGWLAGVIFRRD